MFHTKRKFLTRPADRLAELLSTSGPLPKSFNYLDATAKTFGYADRFAVPESLSCETARDEDLTTAALEKRRIQQSERLSRYALEVGATLPDTRALVDSWQPSAKRPQRRVITSDHAKEMLRQGIEATGFDLVTTLYHKAKNSTECIEKFDVEVVMTAMDCLQMDGKGKSKKYQLLCCDVGALATVLINQGQSPGDINQHNAVQGVTLLDRLCEDDVYPFARVSLFQACMQGWGCTQDYKRARELLKLIDALSERKETLYQNTVDGVFMAWESRLDYLQRKVDVLYAHGEDTEVISTLKEVFTQGHKGNDKGRVIWAARHLLKFAEDGKYPYLFSGEEVANYQKGSANLMLDKDIKGTYYSVA